MDIGQALRVHSQLAHALLPFWDRSPEIQAVVSSLLKEWRTLEVSDDQFLEVATGRLRQNGIRDEEILDAVRHAGKLPVDVYRQLMFDRALRHAKRLYTRHSQWAGGDVRLEVFARQNPIHSGDAAFGAFGVSGSTTPGMRSRDACVVLQHVPQLLGPPSWASIPYVLCHELMCHASQATADSEATDPFTEGWMDDVAAFVHVRYARSLFQWAPGFAADEGARLSDGLRRLNDGLQAVDRLGRYARIQGSRAAAIVRCVLADLSALAPGVSADSLFQRLSVQLNTVPAVDALNALAEHRTFVAHVLMTERDIAARARLAGALRKWIAGDHTAAQVLAF